MSLHIEEGRAGGAGSIPARDSAIPFWSKLIVIIGAFLIAMGGVLALAHPASLVSSHVEINDAVRVYAGYLVSRNLAMAFLLIALLTLHAKRSLSQLMVLVALIQFLDACIDCWEGRWMLVPGVLLICVLFLIGAMQLSGHRPWSKDAWLP
jgi:hypothetical protein